MINRLRHIISVFILFCITVFNLDAQNLNDTLIIHELVVTAARPLSVTGQTRTVIDSLILRDRINLSLSDIMSENSTLFIKSYGRGALASASFRGTAPSHTRVRWNGLEINSPMLGMVDFSQLPSFFIDEISMVHGTGSISEMPGGIGGVLDLNTSLDWKNRFRGDFYQGIGSYGTIDDFLRLNYGNSKFQAGTRLFINHSDNDFLYRNKYIIDSVNFETGEKYHPLSTNTNAGYTNKGILQQFAWRKSPKELLEMNLWLQDSERSLPRLDTDESGENSNVNLQTDNFLRSTIHYQIYGELFKVRFFNGVNFNKLNYTEKNLSFSEDDALFINSQNTALSIDNRGELIFSPSVKDEFEASLRYVNHKVDSYEKIRQNGYSCGRNDFTTNFSWRRKWSDKFRSFITSGTLMVSGKRSALVFNTGGEYHLLNEDKLYIKFDYGHNIRMPTLDDLYYQPGGNPALKSEESKSAEVSIVFNEKTVDGGFSSTATIYRSDVKNWIIWLPRIDNATWAPQNIDLVETAGLELNLNYSGKWRAIGYGIRGIYAYSSSVNYGLTEASYGKQLPYIPLHSANMNMNISFHGFSMIYTWNYFSERFPYMSNESYSLRDELYPYFMNQMRIGKNVEFNKVKLDVNLAIYNLLNEEYRSVLQRPMPGRNYHLMIRLGF